MGRIYISGGLTASTRPACNWFLLLLLPFGEKNTGKQKPAEPKPNFFLVTFPLSPSLLPALISHKRRKGKTKTKTKGRRPRKRKERERVSLPKDCYSAPIPLLPSFAGKYVFWVFTQFTVFGAKSTIFPSPHTSVRHLLREKVIFVLRTYFCAGFIKGEGKMSDGPSGPRLAAAMHYTKPRGPRRRDVYMQSCFPGMYRVFFPYRLFCVSRNAGNGMQKTKRGFSF